jgi:uncharacterized protein (DUF924 family)
MDEAREVREYWFGAQPLTPQALERRMEFWFGAQSEGHDAEIRTRFGALLERAAAGKLAGWADGPRRRLSLILLLDQFPRNMFRGTARAFDYDSQALALSLSGLQSAADGALDFAERLFFYMPLQHAESEDAQDESVAAFRRLLGEVPPELNEIFADALRYAEDHRSVIERFGRFPHRNAVLGRASTPKETEWLAAGGTSFGY